MKNSYYKSIPFFVLFTYLFNRYFLISTTRNVLNRHPKNFNNVKTKYFTRMNSFSTSRIKKLNHIIEKNLKSDQPSLKDYQNLCGDIQTELLIDINNLNIHNIHSLKKTINYIEDKIKKRNAILKKRSNKNKKNESSKYYQEIDEDLFDDDKIIGDEEQYININDKYMNDNDKIIDQDNKIINQDDTFMNEN